MTDRLQASYAYCRTLTWRTAGNFGYAFWTLPAAQHRAMDALYAFMRMSDDLSDDLQVEPTRRAENLQRWRHDLEAALAGRPTDHPIWPAVIDTMQTYGIPEALLVDVIAGMAMDLDPQPFATFEDLAKYCYHVAGAVGLCCIKIWGYHGVEAEQAAIDCGTAFQLTNILRDLAEDAARGRVYLPQADLQRFGYSTDDLQQRVCSRAFHNLMAFETERAWQHYRKAERLTNYLDPSGCRIFRAMFGIYGGLLQKIEDSGFDVYSKRVSLPVWQKLWITGKAMWGREEVRNAECGVRNEKGN
jgi:phytoene synthase